MAMGETSKVRSSNIHNYNFFQSNLDMIIDSFQKLIDEQKNKNAKKYFSNIKNKK